MEELLKFFEFKPGLEFFNSPLFVIIIIIIIGAYVGIHFLRKYLRKRRERALKKKKPSEKKEKSVIEPKQLVATKDSKDIARDIISTLPGYKKEPEKFVPMEPIKPSEEMKSVIKEAVREVMVEGQTIEKKVEPSTYTPSDSAVQPVKEEKAEVAKINISEVRAEIDTMIEQKVSKTLDKRIEEKVDETLKKNEESASGRD